VAHAPVERVDEGGGTAHALYLADFRRFAIHGQELARNARGVSKPIGGRTGGLVVISRHTIHSLGRSFASQRLNCSKSPAIVLLGDTREYERNCVQRVARLQTWHWP